MTDKPLSCPDCWNIFTRFKMFLKLKDRERLQDTRDWAIEHVDTHARGYAPGNVTPEVKEIAEEKR